MDFRCPDSVREAMLRLAENNTYGYSFPAKEYFEAFIGWERERHGCEVKQEWIRHTRVWWPVFIALSRAD